MALEQLVEAPAVGVGETVGSAQQREPGPEQLGVERGGDVASSSFVLLYNSPVAA